VSAKSSGSAPLSTLTPQSMDAGMVQKLKHRVFSETLVSTPTVKNGNVIFIIQNLLMKSMRRFSPAVIILVSANVGPKIKS